MRAPARLYGRGEETGGSSPWMYWIAFAGMAGAGAAVGTLVGTVAGVDLGDAAVSGAVLGMGAMVCWVLWGIGVVAVLALTGRLRVEQGDRWLRRPRRWWDR